MPPLPQLPASADAIWDAYVLELKQDVPRQQEHSSQTLQHLGMTMPYTAVIRGQAPKRGYPLYIALHGGGGVPTELNDSQWFGMQAHYRDSVAVGIYVAPRGVSDTWDLHFRPESYPLYDRLIENMLAFEKVDADRVFILGYSAGGDGVYQIAARMPDRWAAANMSAGHHNDVSPVNLVALPMLLQVGEYDVAYARNTMTVEYAARLVALRPSVPNDSSYAHEVFVHVERPHVFIDNDIREAEQAVMVNPHRWLAERDRTMHLVNTNAVSWLAGHTRNPYPTHLVWDLTTRAAERSTVGQHYWLEVGAHTAQSLGTDVIEASYDVASNSISVQQARTYLALLINDSMLNMKKVLRIKVGMQTLDVQVITSNENQMRTVRQRGDPRYIFEARVVLEQDETGWDCLEGAQVLKRLSRKF